MAAIETRGLTKRFGRVAALTDLDLRVEEGEIYGFLGPNGAGKSTTINVLLDFTRPTSGEVTVLDRSVRAEPRAVRSATGALLEEFGVYAGETGRRHVVEAVRAKRADDDPEALLARVGLAGAADRRASGYSTGMKKRLVLAMALAGEPDLLVLDEPTSGLDPNGIRRLREIIHEEHARGATVFFSSHILGQVEAVCDRVGILHRGRLVTEGSVAELREELAVDGVLRVVVDAVPDGLPASIEALDGVVSVTASATRLDVSCSGGDTKDRVLATVRASTELLDFTTDEPSLEEVFSRYTEDA
jgi:ABC-2 type transport system ATP-binding protein